MSKQATVTHTTAPDPSPAADAGDTPIYAQWAGRVALTRIDPGDLSPTRRAQVATDAEAAGPWYETRYGVCYGIGRTALIRWGGHVHEFDRGTGYCVATPWGLLGDWRIAPEEMPRFRGTRPAFWASRIAETRFATQEAEQDARRLLERGDYETLEAILPPGPTQFPTPEVNAPAKGPSVAKARPGTRKPGLVRLAKSAPKKAAPRAAKSHGKAASAR